MVGATRQAGGVVAAEVGTRPGCLRLRLAELRLTTGNRTALRAWPAVRDEVAGFAGMSERRFATGLAASPPHARSL